jgi:hypothetical protein
MYSGKIAVPPGGGGIRKNNKIGIFCSINQDVLVLSKYQFFENLFTIFYYVSWK